MEMEPKREKTLVALRRCDLENASVRDGKLRLRLEDAAI